VESQGEGTMEMQRNKVKDGQRKGQDLHQPSAKGHIKKQWTATDLSQRQDEGGGAKLRGQT